MVSSQIMKQIQRKSQWSHKAAKVWMGQLGNQNLEVKM